MLKSFNRRLEDYDDFETDYMKVLYYDLPKDYKESYKSYQYNRLCTIIDGEKHIKAGDEEAFTYDKNQFILLPPNSSVDMEITKPTKALVLELNSDLIETIHKRVSLDMGIDMAYDATLFKQYYNEDIKGCLSKIMTLCSGKDENKAFLMDLCAQELVYRLMENKKAHHILTGKKKDPIYKGIEMMKANMTTNMTITEIAQDINMSPAHFSMKFKQVTKMTPRAYFTDLKLMKAKELLEERNVTEVAYDLGYENISYFIKIFKNKYGFTPKQYVKH